MPVSGHWLGVWYGGGNADADRDLQLHFRDGRVSGSGRDSEGAFAYEGTCRPDGRIILYRRYTDGDNCHREERAYYGACHGDLIRGEWRFRKKAWYGGTFEMRRCVGEEGEWLDEMVRVMDAYLAAQSRRLDGHLQPKGEGADFVNEWIKETERREREGSRRAACLEKLMSDERLQTRWQAQLPSRLRMELIAARTRVGWDHAELVQRIGLRKVERQVIRVRRFEEGGPINRRLLLNIGRVLGYRPAAIDALVADDEAARQEAWKRWANDFDLPYVVVRCFAGFYSRTELPEDCLEDQAKAAAHAIALAQRVKLRCCLVWSRRLSIFYAADGSLERRAEATADEDPRPRMVLKSDDPLPAGVAILSQPPSEPAVPTSSFPTPPPSPPKAGQ